MLARIDEHGNIERYSMVKVANLASYYISSNHYKKEHKNNLLNLSGMELKTKKERYALVKNITHKIMDIVIPEKHRDITNIEDWYVCSTLKQETKYMAKTIHNKPDKDRCLYVVICVISSGIVKKLTLYKTKPTIQEDIDCARSLLKSIKGF